MQVTAQCAQIGHAQRMSAHSTSRAFAWWRASRPGFLLVTLFAATTGIAQSQACGCGWDPAAAVATVLLALLAHAAINLHNDVGDALGGSDAVNHGRIGPFTGGSRAIQDGVFSLSEVQDAVKVLAGVVVVGGILLAARVGPALLLLGLAGLALGWAYSSPKVGLMNRGWGELSVALAWWAVVWGADLVQRHQFSALAAISGVSIGLLVAAVLWVAEFPDAAADAQVGKHTLVVRWGPDVGAVVYTGAVFSAHLWVAAWWWVDWLPSTAWWALGSAPLSLWAAALLWRHRHQPQRLRLALQCTVAAAVLHGALMTAAFVAIARLR